jgi:hypothetical protein
MLFRSIIVASILALMGIGCSCEDSAKSTLRSHGFTNIRTTGWGGPLRCSDSDRFNTGFEATNPQGQRVSGVVCCGLFKNCTVRF